MSRSNNAQRTTSRNGWCRRREENRPTRLNPILCRPAQARPLRLDSACLTFRVACLLRVTSGKVAPPPDACSSFNTGHRGYNASESWRGGRVSTSSSAPPTAAPRCCPPISIRPWSRARARRSGSPSTDFDRYLSMYPCRLPSIRGPVALVDSRPKRECRSLGRVGPRVTRG